MLLLIFMHIIILNFVFLRVKMHEMMIYMIIIHLHVIGAISKPFLSFYFEISWSYVCCQKQQLHVFFWAKQLYLVVDPLCFKPMLCHTSCTTNKSILVLSSVLNFFLKKWRERDERRSPSTIPHYSLLFLCFSNPWHLNEPSQQRRCTNCVKPHAKSRLSSAPCFSNLHWFDFPLTLSIV